MNPRGTRRQAISFASLTAESLCTTLARYDIRFSNGPMVAAACLSASIADGLVALVRILDSRGQRHALTLAREVIESLLELEMICVNSKFSILPLWLANAQDRVQLGEQFLIEVKDIPYDLRTAVAADIAAQTALVKMLERRGVKRLDVYEKFGYARVSSEFWTFYWRSCLSAHNDLRALETRRLRGRHIVIGERLSNDDVREIVIISASVALRVYECAPKFLDVTAEELLPQWDLLLPGLHRIAHGDATRSV